MNRKKFAKKWIKLLRSGKYIQIKHEYGDPARTNKCCAVGLTNVLPLDIVEGMDMNYNFVTITGTSIYALNDEDFTFDEIADLLQAVYIEGALDA